MISGILELKQEQTYKIGTTTMSEINLARLTYKSRGDVCCIVAKAKHYHCLALKITRSLECLGMDDLSLEYISASKRWHSWFCPFASAHGDLAKVHGCLWSIPLLEANSPLCIVLVASGLYNIRLQTNVW
jgi:hypothetical protein